MSTRPSRFIINSDMATTKKLGERTLTITLPDSRFVPQDADAYVTATADISEFKSASYRVMLKSSKYSYASPLTSFIIPCQQDGYGSGLPGSIYRTGNTLEMRIQFPSAYGQDTTWTGMGQTITANVEFFEDPFEQ